MLFNIDRVYEATDRDDALQVERLVSRVECHVHH